MITNLTKTLCCIISSDFKAKTAKGYALILMRKIYKKNSAEGADGRGRFRG
jgi:hypothetical protein